MHVYSCVRVFLGYASVCGHNIMAWLLVSECVGVRVSGDAGSCVTTTHFLSPPRKSALQWVLHMTDLSLWSPLGFLSWNQICTYFSLANQCKWEYFLNGCLKCQDFAENVTHLLPTCTGFIFKRHTFTRYPLNWQITLSGNCTMSVILTSISCMHVFIHIADIKGLVHQKKDY